MIYTIAPSLLLRQEQKRCAVSIGGPPFRGNGNGGCSGVSGANGGPTLQVGNGVAETAVALEG